MKQLDEAHLRELEANKQSAVAAFEEALAAIEQQRREPDQWERAHMMEAICAISRGAYDSGDAEITRAMTLPSGRSPMPYLPEDPFHAQCNIALFREELSKVKAEPVRRSVRQGPIKFTG